MMLATLRRELLIGWRGRSEAAMPLIFFVLACFCFGLGAAPNSPLLAQFAPAIVWVCAALAILLGAERCYADDFRDGVLEQFVIAGIPLSWVCAAKLLVNWLLLGLPIAVIAPLMALAFGLPLPAALVLGLAMGLGTMVFMGLASFMAALSLAVSRPGMLLPLLVLPLSVPTVIFGAGAVRASISGMPVAGPLYFAAALALLSLCLVPLGSAAALENAMDA